MPLNAIASLEVGNKADLLTPLCWFPTLSALQGILIDKMQKRKCWQWVVRGAREGGGFFGGTNRLTGDENICLMKLYARENFCVNEINFKHGATPTADASRGRETMGVRVAGRG